MARFLRLAQGARSTSFGSSSMRALGARPAGAVGQQRSIIHGQYIFEREHSFQSRSARNGHFSTVTPSGSVGSEKENATVEKKSKLRTLWERYGRVAIGTYIGVYAGTLSGVFVLYESGMMVDACPLIESSGSGNGGEPNMYMQLFDKLGMDKYVDPETLTPTQGNFLLAWLTTKITEPARAVLTGILTPSIARHLGYAPQKIKKDGESVAEEHQK